MMEAIDLSSSSFYCQLDVLVFTERTNSIEAEVFMILRPDHQVRSFLKP